jgi:hypothetical protein
MRYKQASPVGTCCTARNLASDCASSVASFSWRTAVRRPTLGACLDCGRRALQNKAGNVQQKDGSSAAPFA